MLCDQVPDVRRADVVLNSKHEGRVKIVGVAIPSYSRVKCKEARTFENYQPLMNKTVKLGNMKKVMVKPLVTGELGTIFKGFEKHRILELPSGTASTRKWHCG